MANRCRAGSLGSSRGHDKALATARAVTFQSHRLRQQLAPFSGDFQPPVPYPKGDSGFPDRMAGLAAMLASGTEIGRPFRHRLLRLMGRYALRGVSPAQHAIDGTTSPTAAPSERPRRSATA